MASFVKIMLVITSVVICTANEDANLTAEFRAMNWTQLRDYVYNNTPTTTESIVHHYVQKVLNNVEGMEDKLGGAVRKEINYFTGGIAHIFFGLLLFGGITFGIIACGNLHFCCSILKSERDTHKYVKQTIDKAEEDDKTDKTNETTTV